MAYLPKIAIQGEEGSFSEEAGRKYWGNTVVFLPKRSFEDVVVTPHRKHLNRKHLHNL